MDLEHFRESRLPKILKESCWQPARTKAGLLFFTSAAHIAAAASSVLCPDTRPLGLWKPPCLLPSSLTCRQHKTSLCGERPQRRRLGRLLRKGLLLTVPLLARCVGHSSGDVLISPELAA